MCGRKTYNAPLVFDKWKVYSFRATCCFMSGMIDVYSFSAVQVVMEWMFNERIRDVFRAIHRVPLGCDLGKCNFPVSKSDKLHIRNLSLILSGNIHVMEMHSRKRTYIVCG